MPQTKTVTLVLRDGWHMNTSTVDVLWNCPTCGETMGEPKGHNFIEDGHPYFCHRWENPCGHVAHYEDVKIKRKDGSFISWKEIKENRKVTPNEQDRSDFKR